MIKKPMSIATTTILLVCTLGGCGKQQMTFEDAILKGNADEVRRHLAQDVDANQDITVKLDRGVELWAGPGANITAHPIVLAICLGHLDIVEMLLDHGVDPNGDMNQVRDLGGMTMSGSIKPATAAASFGNVATLRLLCDRGAEVDANLLVDAIHANKPEFVEFLAPRVGDLNEKYLGRSPLWFARQSGNQNIVEILIKHGAKQ